MFKTRRFCSGRGGLWHQHTGSPRCVAALGSSCVGSPQDPVECRAISQVNLILDHNTPRYLATGVDPNDLQRLAARSRTGGNGAASGVRRPRGMKSWRMRRPRRAAWSRPLMRTCAPRSTTIMQSIFLRTIPTNIWQPTTARSPVTGSAPLRSIRRRSRWRSLMAARKSSAICGAQQVARPPVAIVLPGLDACKEELHAWCDAFVRRGLASLAIDGPGQGETAFRLPITTKWGAVIGAVIDWLSLRDDVNAKAVAVIGQSLGALYAPLAAAFEPRIKACVANCGPFDFGAVLPTMPGPRRKRSGCVVAPGASPKRTKWRNT